MEDNFDINDIEDIDDLDYLEIEDILQYIEECIEKKDNSIVRFVRDLVQKRCLN